MRTATAHRHGARVFVDGAQLLPHRTLSLASSGVDHVAFSGHKLYAPYGAGALVGRRDWLDAAEPHLAGGGAVRSVGHDGDAVEVSWGPAPARHEAGSPNVIGAIALGAACATLRALDPEETRAHEDALRVRLVDGLEVLGARIARLWTDAIDATATVTFSLAGDPGLLAAYLSAEHAIGVRDGRFCAHPLLDRLGLSGGAVRVSLGLGSTADDVDRLLFALADYSEDEARRRYHVVDGCWAAADDPRPLPHVTGGLGLAATAAVCGT